MAQLLNIEDIRLWLQADIPDLVVERLAAKAVGYLENQGIPVQQKVKKYYFPMAAVQQGIVWVQTKSLVIVTAVKKQLPDRSWKTVDFEQQGNSYVLNISMNEYLYSKALLIVRLYAMKTEYVTAPVPEGYLSITIAGDIPQTISIDTKAEEKILQHVKQYTVQVWVE